MSDVMSRPAAAHAGAQCRRQYRGGAEQSRCRHATRRRASRPSSACPRGTSLRSGRSAAGEPVVKFGQIIGFAKADIPPGDWVHEHNCGIGEDHGAFDRDYAFCEGVVPAEFVAGGAAGDVRGLSARQRQRRHAQLCRHPDLGELLGDGRRVHRQGDRALGHSRRLSRTSTASWRSKQANGCVIDYRGESFDILKRTHLGLCHQPQYGRGDHGRARLRGVPDPQAQGSLRRHRERDVPHHDHPGDRRHQKDRRGRRRGGARRCCRSSTRRSARRCRRPN